MTDEARAEGLSASTAALTEAVERTAVEMVLERLRAPSDGEARAAQAHAEMWLGLADRVLARVDRWLALREAAARVKPPEDPPPAPAPEAEWVEVLEYLAARPPAAEAAERLRAIGVEAAHVPALLEELGTEPGWAAWVDSSRGWIEEVSAALTQSSAPAEAEEATCN